jgi:endonuclease/exonuclease/phosphatase family metal-dependent hydrolase
MFIGDKRINILTILAAVFLIAACGKNNINNSNNTTDQTGDSTQQERTVLKIMTYNIHHGNPPGYGADVRDMKGIANVINAQKPDLVCLNEVDVNNERSGMGLNEAAAIAKLTGMNYYFAKAMDYEGGYYGDAVLSKFPILDSTRYPMSYVLPGSETRDVAMITIKVHGEKILFASTHLDHLGPEDNRIYQAKTLADSILPNLKHPLIIGGDLNSPPNSKTIGILKKKLTMGCSGSDCPFTFPYNKPTASIDYIMFMPANKFTFVGYRAIRGMVASDHLPLVAMIRIN